MKGYNRVMEIFWLSMGLLIVLVVTVMGIKDGFKAWYVHYGFSVIAFVYYLIRRYMRKRMEKHQQWLNENKPEKK
jgi:hypothetical protein